MEDADDTEVLEGEFLTNRFESMCDDPMTIKFRKVFEEDNSLRHRRNRLDSICDPLHYIYSDPPWIAKQLAFTVYDKKDKLKDLICNIKDGFYDGLVKKNQIIDIEGYTKELGEMISTDPRLGDLLELDFLMLIVRLLKSQQSPRLQAYAASILRPVVAFSHNEDDVCVVIQSVTPVVLNLICSQVDLVRVKAHWLLRNLVFKISKSSIEEFLAPVTSIILKDSDGFGVLHPASEILSVVCQEHPKISREKLNVVVPALIKLIESDFLLLLTSGCWGLACLCDGREEMVIEDKDLKHLIRRLVHITNYEERAAVISGLTSLGSIARWGSDSVIKAIIEDKGSLHIFSLLLEVDDMYIVKQVCWIISNITARKREHILDVLCGGCDISGVRIDCNFLHRLAKIVRNCELADVVKEALWAISNAMCGLGSDQLTWFLETCIRSPLPRRLLQFESDKLLVLVFLEGFVKIQAVRVTWDGQEIDDAKLHLIFKDMVYDSDMFTKCGLLSPDDNALKSGDRATYDLQFTFIMYWQPYIVFRLCYYSSMKDFIIQSV